jgi:hypothetical protein
MERKTETGTCFLTSPGGIRRVDVTKVDIPVKTWKDYNPERDKTFWMTGFEKLKCSMDYDMTKEKWELTKLSCTDTSKKT